MAEKGSLGEKRKIIRERKSGEEIRKRKRGEGIRESEGERRKDPRELRERMERIRRREMNRE